MNARTSRRAFGISSVRRMCVLTSPWPSIRHFALGAGAMARDAALRRRGGGRRVDFARRAGFPGVCWDSAPTCSRPTRDLTA